MNDDIILIPDYEDGFRDGLQAAWDEIDRWIVKGEIPQWQAQRRNGMVLAANQVMMLISRLSVNQQEMRK